MKKIQKILFAIDFSESSFNALDTAVYLAEKCKATLYILHVQDNIFDFIRVSALTINSVANNSSDILTALANDIQKKSGVMPEIIEETGYVTEGILKTVIKYRCDLVVMGTYGASGYRNGYIGTTAYSVIKFAPCPVLLIPSSRKWLSFKKPLFPIRSVMTALRHYDVVRNLIEEYSTLYILGLFATGEQNGVNDLTELVAEMKERLTADNIMAKAHSIGGSSISQNVLKQAEKNNADLVIVTPVIDVSTKQFYVGPHAHYIIHNAKVPTLVINRINVHSPATVKVTS